MRYFFRLLGAIVIIVITWGSVAGETIKIAYFNLPPHSMQENGKHVGALIEYWNNYFAPAMGVEPEWEGPLPPVRLLKLLELGKINVIALLAKNEERLKLFDFPEKPFFQMDSGLAFLKSHPLNAIKSIEDIAGLKIGFFEKGFVPPVMRDPRIKWDNLLTVTWQEQNILKVVNNRLDAAFNAESYSLLYLVKKMNYGDLIKVFNVPGTTTENFALFSKKDNGHFLQLYMKAQVEVDKKIQYRDILQAYIK